MKSTLFVWFQLRVGADRPGSGYDDPAAGLTVGVWLPEGPGGLERDELADGWILSEAIARSGVSGGSG